MTENYLSGAETRHLSQQERVARGKAARSAAPRSSHAEFHPPPKRTDPVEIIEKQSVGLVQPSIIRVGGLTEAIKIGHAAETYSIGVAPHNPHGPIAIAASVTLAAVLSNFVILESYENDNPPSRSRFVNEGPSIEGDHYTVSDMPGLGIEIDECRLGAICSHTDRLVA